MPSTSAPNAPPSPAQPGQARADREGDAEHGVDVDAQARGHARVIDRGAQPAEMAGLGAATVVGRDIIETARRCVLGFGGQQQFAVIGQQGMTFM